MCLSIQAIMIYDINELYKHIDILNLFYRNLGTGTPVQFYGIIHSDVRVPEKMLKLTENAIERLRKITTDHGKQYCRLSVKGGGCAGFEYEWSTTNNEERGDVLLENVLVVNRDYELFLLGTTLDWEKGAFKSEFTITNPNSKSTCGCGESFSV